MYLEWYNEIGILGVARGNWYSWRRAKKLVLLERATELVLLEKGMEIGTQSKVTKLVLL